MRQMVAEFVPVEYKFLELRVALGEAKRSVPNVPVHHGLSSSVAATVHGGRGYLK